MVYFLGFFFTVFTAINETNHTTNVVLFLKAVIGHKSALNNRTQYDRRTIVSDVKNWDNDPPIPQPRRLENVIGSNHNWRTFLENVVTTRLQRRSVCSARRRLRLGVAIPCLSVILDWGTERFPIATPPGTRKKTPVEPPPSPPRSGTGRNDKTAINITQDVPAKM